MVIQEIQGSQDLMGRVLDQGSLAQMVKQDLEEPKEGEVLVDHQDFQECLWRLVHLEGRHLTSKKAQLPKQLCQKPCQGSRVNQAELVQEGHMENEETQASLESLEPLAFQGLLVMQGQVDHPVMMETQGLEVLQEAQVFKGKPVRMAFKEHLADLDLQVTRV